MRALALVDGEHYAPVVRDAIAGLPHDILAAHLIGGTEKLRGGEDYGVPVVDDLEAAITEHSPDLVVDLSDEPVLGPRQRFRVASRVLAHGIPYEGADFRLEPAPLGPFPLASLSVIGTGKRVGKTAVTGYVARFLARERDVVVVAMGRGGPEEPECVEVRPTVESLLELSRAGRHAASDYLETAALSGVVTIGCRRCAGGLAGATAADNVAAGAELALERSPDLVVFDGSGAAIPPVATTARLLVVNADCDPELATGYLNAYRILISDLVVLTMAVESGGHDELAKAIREVKPNLTVIAAELRPRPLEPVEGRRVAYFTTAPEEAHGRLATHLRDDHGAEVVHVSGNLARRDALAAELAGIDADVYLVEIKAAAIDVVAEAGAKRGVSVVFADNEVVPLPGQPDLEAALRALLEIPAAEPART
ncbi:MAG: 2,3-diphosphoglycerate synthetase [Actinomycetota bacterium]|nr:2,3-diphosphoglycerate synthetase [Actinomycetota bacterium]